ncbi:hypothetical protein LCGC14_0719850 [marine sediment metagenome]|jgi:DNA-binding HxlR family transcriptional regulator|uniref:HTH hxlR-type domain-containing protein n=1 Tax=marine sediment metagenome TaxID=412755 RepID=A0A0F9QXU6_9ZZZZ
MIKMEKICPITTIIEVLSKKWTLLILRQLNGSSKKRFNELLKEVVNITPRTLSKRLKELIKIKVIKKRQFNEIPPRVEYKLTESGRELIKCFRYLDDWAKNWG